MDHPLLGREEFGAKLFLYLDIEFIELLQTLRTLDIVHLAMVPGGGSIQTNVESRYFNFWHFSLFGFQQAGE